MNKIKIVFASHNKHKIDEIKQILGDRFEITSLTDLAEMTNEEKNVISHRGIAVRKLKEFLLNKIC